MLYSTYRPSDAPLYSRDHADTYHSHPQRPPHSNYADTSSSAVPLGSATASYDRFEYKAQALDASLVESRLFGNALVRDCSVIGVSQSGGVAVTLSPGQVPVAGTAPIAFVALSSPGRERSMQGGDKESKRMKTELIKWIVDYAPLFKQIKGKLIFVESIPRCPAGSVLRHLLVEKATSPPAPGPDKGFFNTVLSEPTTPAGPSKASSVAGDTSHTASPPKKAVRDSKRRATHSQIERRRREKINDRLVTLRSIVPACAKELEDRRRQKQEQEDEAARIAAGGAPKTYIDAATGKPKRKRNRKKPDTKKAAGADKEEELGLHKLEVLTHAINYIFELKAYIHKLETGSSPEHVPTADNPYGVRNADGTYRQDAKIEDEPGCGAEPRLLASDGIHLSTERTETKPAQPKRSVFDENDDESEESEEDQIEDDVAEGDDEEGPGPAAEDDDDDGDEPLERRSKKHMAYSSSHHSQHPLVKTESFAVPTRYLRTDTTYSSSSSRESAEVSPVFSLIQQSPNTISPATTVTSPMMSLSAESPIMLPDPAISMSKRTSLCAAAAARVCDSSVGFSTLPASAMPLPDQAGRRESSSFLFKQLSLTSPNFTPFNPSVSAASVRPFASTYGEESEVRGSKVTGLSDRDASAAAALLLNFSTSPEVLRPIGARSSPHTRPTAGLPTRRSTFDSPQYKPTRLREEGEAQQGQEEGLASPPHLALDSSSSPNDAEDGASERTVDDLPVAKTEGAEAAVEMDTAAYSRPANGQRCRAVGFKVPY